MDKRNARLHHYFKIHTETFAHTYTLHVPLAGAAAAERAKHSDKNSLVLLFEAFPFLKIVEGVYTGCP